MEIQPVHSKEDQSWVFFGRTDAKAETPILWPPQAKIDSLEKTLCWEELVAGWEGDNRGWDGWMASPTRWTWVWVNWNWWWTGRPGILQSMELQRIRYDWASELNWAELKYGISQKEESKYFPNIPQHIYTWQLICITVKHSLLFTKKFGKVIILVFIEEL